MDETYGLAIVIVFIYFLLLAMTGVIGTLKLIDDDSESARAAIADCIAKGGAPLKQELRAIRCAVNS